MSQEDTQKDTTIHRITDLEKRVVLLDAHIENEKKSLFKRLNSYGGIVALGLSILIGGVTLLDRFLFDSIREREALHVELHNIVGRLTEINWQLIELEANGLGDRLPDFQQTANGEKASLIQRASLISTKLEDEVDFSVATILAFENLAFGDSVVAHRYASRALDTAPNLGFKSTAHTYLARTYFSPGELLDLQKGREAFREAISTADQLNPGLATNWALMPYGDWILGEAYYGDCSIANDLVEEVGKKIASTPNPRLLSSQFFGQVARRNAGQTRCAVSFP